MDTLIVTSHHHHKAARNVTSLCNNKPEGPANDPGNQLWKTKNCWKFIKTNKISDFPSALLCSRDFMMANGDVRTALGELWFLEMHETAPHVFSLVLSDSQLNLYQNITFVLLMKKVPHISVFLSISLFFHIMC